MHRHINKGIVMPALSAHKIWVILFTLTTLVISNAASSRPMTNMPMTSSMTTESMTPSVASSTPHCDPNMTEMAMSHTSSNADKSTSHCNKMPSNDCCPAVCLAFAIPLQLNDQDMLRQPHRTLVTRESNVNTITRSSSLYRPPIV